MKFLVICRGAVVRSVAQALVLKERGHDAVCLSYDWNSDKLFNILCKWADKIVLMRAKFEDRIPKYYRSKVVINDVGEDIWGNPLNDELLKLCRDFVKKQGWAD